MTSVKAYAAQSAESPLAPLTIDRRDPGPHDVVIDIAYCGVCHSDVHAVRNDWGRTRYPIVPGHEITGHVVAVGNEVKRWKPGDTVGVGCMVNSCRECSACHEHQEQYCERGMTATYNSIDKRGDRTVTKGGYSTRIVVNEDFVLRIPPGMPLDRTAPLLCAGITTYSPLHRHGVTTGTQVGIVGLGGLGHVAVKIAKALGAHVTMISHSERKKADAAQLGADDFLLTRDPEVFKGNAKRFDFILDTISANHDYNAYLNLLRLDGTMVVLGLPEPAPVSADTLIQGRRSLAGSLIGGIKETQEMLDFCAKHGVLADIELIPASKINEAYDRMVKSDVRYRFVIDGKSFG
ncbi:MAG TPA: NAD(P)-dependent alcohol dehydrogenase [Flavobacteriales bacterium]|nr:NAD(P)-dependent alcohol dehydrogenase [Flavobacteriales bacterium]HRQ85244.1 NAD(P)-dependent alcohol dehydrogenase [Flavobacteriales bacterium]